jgi:SNF2 family DNA or RNA helicase
MATIHISLGTAGQILIKPVGEIATEEWLSLQNWWSSEPAINQLSCQIAVLPSEFAYKKNWLRENWTRLGHKVELDKEVIESVQVAEGLITDFEILSKNQNRTADIEFLGSRLKRKLTSFQVLNLNNLVTMNNGANFSVPGAGKTSTTLAVWEYFRVVGKVQRLLVICPRSAFEAWEKEPGLILEQTITIHQFSEESIPPDTDLLYVNYEQLENSSRLLRITKWMDQAPTMLVIDEAHRVKGGGKSIRWKSCLELGAHAVRVDLLTGTPMPQSQEDLKNLFCLSWQGIPRHFLTNARLSSLQRGGVFVRTTKRELELPPMRIELVTVTMSPVQRDIYSALRRTFAGQFGMSDGDYGYFEKKGKAVMTLLAAATNPGLLMRSYSEESFLGFNWPPINLSGEERLYSVLQSYSSHEISEKYLWIAKFVSKAAADGRKVIIWSTFVGNLLALQRLLAPYEPALIYGGTSAEERNSELERFRKSSLCHVLLSNPQTLGEGVSLHKECHVAVYVDRSYNAGLYLQSLDRIHRLGLPPEQETTVYVLRSEGSIDVCVDKRLQAKIDRLGTYLNDEGLVEVSLPSGDSDDPPEGLLGLDDIDLNTLLDHLGNDDY